VTPTGVWIPLTSLAGGPAREPRYGDVIREYWKICLSSREIFGEEPDRRVTEVFRTGPLRFVLGLLSRAAFNLSDASYREMPDVQRELARLFLPQAALQRIDQWRRSAAVAAASWIDVRTPSPSPLTERLSEVLGTGEAAAIGLCLELQAALLLCDDLEARPIAAAQGLRVVGTPGTLVRGKRAGRLDAVRPIVEAMVAMALRVSPDLVEGILVFAGAK
jgi:predicted nucleic acid-binding protein